MAELRIGRKVALPRYVITVKDLIRRHLKEEGKGILDLAAIWRVHRCTAYNIMYKPQYTVGPERVRAVIAALQLDEFDAQELNIAGAREMGWRIKTTLESCAPVKPGGA